MTSSNRGNWLLLNFLQKTYPELFTEKQAEVDLMAYLSTNLAGQGERRWTTVEELCFSFFF